MTTTTETRTRRRRPSRTPELWTEVPVQGYENHYAVSNLGRIKRTAPGRNTWPGRVLRPTRHHNGWLSVNLHCAALGQRRAYVHVLVSRAFGSVPVTPTVTTRGAL